MRWLVIIGMLVSVQAFSQCKTYIIGVHHDTLNCTDTKDLKQGKWVVHMPSQHGEPGYEEEGIFIDGKKEGPWRKYTLQGDVLAIENYKFGYKNGLCDYYDIGGLEHEESWKATNPINPLAGAYANIVLRNNYKFLGSDENWQSLLIDARKYFCFPAHSNNILAFWTYDWLVLNGTPPYLDLPSTAWDTYTNTGRGYIQGRFRGRQMLYLETEYRYGITRNGLLGGVVFANAQSFSQWPGNYTFRYVQPAAGLGLRIKLNKVSKTNIDIDYGFGLGNSHGLFINIAEVF